MSAGTGSGGLSVCLPGFQWTLEGFLGCGRFVCPAEGTGWTETISDLHVIVGSRRGGNHSLDLHLLSAIKGK